MSTEARMRQVIDDAVREATAPLERAVKELSARLDAVGGSGGPADVEAPKRAPRGRTAKAKAQTAEVTAITGDGVQVESTDDAAADAEKVPEQRKGGNE